MLEAAQQKSAILTILVFIWIVTLSGCTNSAIQPQLPEECLAENMLISKEDISAIYAQSVISPVPSEPINSAINTFSAGPGLATYRLAHYLDCGEKAYKSALEFRFQVEDENGFWEVPDIAFNSTVADDFQYACITRHYDTTDQVKCMYVGRYQDYVVSLWMYIYPGNYDFDDFASGMTAIDREMSECFTALDEADARP